MSLEIPAIFEKGVFRPIGPIPELREGSSVTITIPKILDTASMRKLRGALSREDAEEMNRIIKEGRSVEGNW